LKFENTFENMDFVRLEQVSPGKLESIHFDMFIAVSGYELRCTYLMNNYSINAEQKIAFGFTEKTSELYRSENNELIRESGFSIVNCSGDESDTIVNCIKDAFKSLDKNTLNVLIDYSCMTKVWYANIINYFLQEEETLKKVNCFFSYTTASFDPPKKIKPVKNVYSVFTQNKVFHPEKPTALVIGLGIEKIKAKALQKKINPDHTILMYADPSADKNYVKTLFDKNGDIITKVGARNLVNYPLNDIKESYEILTSLCLDLRLKYNIILAPLGPKVHSLICLLVSAQYPDIDVWRVNSGKNEPVYDRKPVNDPLVMEVIFANEEE